MTIATTLSATAQQTTIAFDALGFMTGNACADTFYPPGNASDFFGFQYLRDNDTSAMGHNTAFAATVADDVVSLLTDSQVQALVDISKAVAPEMTAYAYDRFALMAAFRRLLSGNLPPGTTGLSEAAVEQYSADQLYRLDAEMSYSRAQVLAAVLASLTAKQLAEFHALVGVGVSKWPTAQPVAQRWASQLDNDQMVEFMTNASELFSWYAGSLAADTYFSPERQGTYFGSFYLKDGKALLAQAAGHNVTISTSLTHDYGTYLLGTLDPGQRAAIEGLYERQLPALDEIVATRQAIAAQLLLLRTGTAAEKAAVKTKVLTLEARYGQLDGEISYLYATAFSQVYKSLSPAQRAKLMTYRQSNNYLGFNSSLADPCTLHPATSAYLYSQLIAMPSVGSTDGFFK